MKYAVNVFRKDEDEDDLMLMHNKLHNIISANSVSQAYESVVSKALGTFVDSIVENISDEFDNNVEEAMSNVLTNAVTYVLEDTDILVNDIEATLLHPELDIAIDEPKLQAQIVKKLLPKISYDVVYSDGITRVIYVKENDVEKGRVIVTEVVG